MRTYLYCADNHLPHHLNENEIASPKSVIREHFSLATLDEWRYTIWLWLCSTTTEGLIWHKLHEVLHRPSELHYTHEYINKLIEAISIMADKDSVSKEHIKQQSKKKHIKVSIKCRPAPKLIEIREKLYVIQFLSDQEISNPYLVFPQLFRCYTLDNWRYMLSEWFYYGLAKSSNRENIWANDTLYFYVQLVRLTEACFLINELENKDSS